MEHPTGLRVAVVGTGLIGGSVLLRLRAAGVDVEAWDPDPATRAEGRRQGFGFPDQLADAVRDRDVVFLCGPLPTLPETLTLVAGQVRPDCVLTDVGSTKVPVATYALTRGLAGRFVPGHPMAGTERAGLTSARPDLFEGAAWVLCPPPEGPLDGFRRLAVLVVTVFGARVVPMTPPVHDAVVALSSHIPHLLAGALAGAVGDSPLRAAVLGLAAGSFADGTRVAGTPPVRTVNMLRSNRTEILRQLGDVTDFLAGLVEALRADDIDTLVDRYQRAASTRSALRDRAHHRSVHRFPVTVGAGGAGGEAAERAFLVELGEAGGHLSGCVVDGRTVTYTGHRPVGPV